MTDEKRTADRFMVKYFIHNIVGQLIVYKQLYVIIL